MKSPRGTLVVAALALVLATTAACSSDDDAKDAAKVTSSVTPKPEAKAKASTVPYEKDKFKGQDKDQPKYDGLGTGKDQSNNDGDRPTAGELAGSLTSDNSLIPRKVDAAEALCVAEIVVKSDLTNSAVRALYNKNTKFDPSKKDLTLLRKLDDVYTKKCL